MASGKKEKHPVKESDLHGDTYFKRFITTRDKFRRIKDHHNRELQYNQHRAVTMHVEFDLRRHMPRSATGTDACAKLVLRQILSPDTLSILDAGVPKRKASNTTTLRTTDSFYTQLPATNRTYLSAETIALRIWQSLPAATGCAPAGRHRATPRSRKLPPHCIH